MSARSRLGETIGDYRLLEEIGAGSHGSFYLAEPPARLDIDAQRVAVKVLDHHATDSEFRRVANELRILAAVRSPHLVELHEAGCADGVLFYCMPFYPEGSLALSFGQPVDVLGQAVADAARGAHALHEVGVVHRDIKPQNVLMRERRGVLSDLGLAALLEPGMTSTGHGPIGTIEYMEPQLIRGEKATRQTDIWSLGITLHRVLSGEGIHGEIDDRNVLAALQQILREPPRISNGVPGGFRDVIERCIEPDAGDRFATSEELASAIENALAEREEAG